MVMQCSFLIKKKWVGGWVLITSNNYFIYIYPDLIDPYLVLHPPRGGPKAKILLGFDKAQVAPHLMPDPGWAR